ncbi:MAG: hypothetical protein DSZ12_01155 [Sulfurovum sp.]|nr:MAG: hypothetical protein DSZ12_01155 [Sulfurovum sp.]
MKKQIWIALVLLQQLHASGTDTFEGRKGFLFGIGIVAIGGCGKDDIWDESGENIIGTDTSCGAIPLLDLGLGYHFSKQFALSLDIKTLGIATLMGIKAKYYLEDEKDTSFVSITGGALNVGGVHSGFIGSYNNIEWGYAYEHNEFSLGIGAPYGDSTILLHLGYKYVF